MRILTRLHLTKKHQLSSLIIDAILLGAILLKFLFTNKYLMYIGLDTPYDQYAFYGTSLVFIGGSFRPLRKAYFFLLKSVFANTLGWFVNEVFDRPEENLRTTIR